jgi:hypothetical protein
MFVPELPAYSQSHSSVKRVDDLGLLVLVRCGRAKMPLSVAQLYTPIRNPHHSQVSHWLMAQLSHSRAVGYGLSVYRPTEGVSLTPAPGLRR